MASFNPSSADWQAIEGLDLREVVTATARARRWSEERSERALLWYRRHLYLARRNQGKSLGMLAKDADILWHNHIVDTRKYEDDCKAAFGRFLHHAPGLHAKARTAARQAYLSEFGRVPPNFTDDCWFAW